MAFAGFGAAEPQRRARRLAGGPWSVRL